MEDEFESSKEKSTEKGVTNDNITDEVIQQPGKKSAEELSSSVKSIEGTSEHGDLERSKT